MIQAHTVGVRMYHGASIFETFVTSERPIRADLKTLPGAQQTQVIESETWVISKTKMSTNSIQVKR